MLLTNPSEEYHLKQTIISQLGVCTTLLEEIEEI